MIDKVAGQNKAVADVPDRLTDIGDGQL